MVTGCLRGYGSECRNPACRQGGECDSRRLAVSRNSRRLSLHARYVDSAFAIQLPPSPLGASAQSKRLTLASPFPMTGRSQVPPDTAIPLHFGRRIGAQLRRQGRGRRQGVERQPGAGHRVVRGGHVDAAPLGGRGNPQGDAATTWTSTSSGAAEMSHAILREWLAL